MGGPVVSILLAETLVILTKCNKEILFAYKLIFVTSNCRKIDSTSEMSIEESFVRLHFLIFEGGSKASPPSKFLNCELSKVMNS